VPNRAIVLWYLGGERFRHQDGREEEAKVATVGS
jgi:hypothetical protein